MECIESGLIMHPKPQTGTYEKSRGEICASGFLWICAYGLVQLAREVGYWWPLIC